MDNPIFNILSICSGVGMLDEGFERALEFHGVRARVVAYVEREASAAAMLLARMEEKSLEPAPVWCGSLEDLPIADIRYLGRVDCVLGGIPCQPFSQAGQQKGVEDARWLWPIMRDLAGCVGADWIGIENVGGFVRDGLEPVLHDLAESGWVAEWLHLSASEVGASHKRERIFVLAHAEHVAGCSQWRTKPGQRPDAESGDRAMLGQAGSELGNTASDHERRPLNASDRQGKSDRGSGGDVANSESKRSSRERSATPERWIGNSDSDGGSQDVGNSDISKLPLGERDGNTAGGGGFADAGKSLGRPHGTRRKKTWRGSGEHTRCESQQGCGDMADTSGQGLQGSKWRGTHGKQSSTSRRSACKCSCLSLFAPGPKDARWPGILDQCPHFAPATEPGLCVLVDGVAVVLDADRADALRAGGNGVVALCAAVAFAELFQRIGGVRK